MELNATGTNEVDIRRAKLAALSENNNIPYKAKFTRTHTIAEARELPVADEGRSAPQVSVCGRLISKRRMGKLIFAHIYDIGGTIQVMLSKNDNEAAFELFKTYIDVGDFIGATGVMYLTKAGEITVKAADTELLSKSLRPLPEKFHGLSDRDTRYRQRYLDIIANEDSRNTFLTRFKIIARVRAFMTERGFTEVETPILQTVACGANARPFVTHHNALDTDLFLRIAPELFLKEVVAAGFDRVFEIGKNFRNEGMDPSHLQEFTMIEWYASYWDYRDNMEFIAALLRDVIQSVKGGLKFTYQGTELDFAPEFPVIDYCKEISGVLGFDILKEKDVTVFRNAVIAKLNTPKDEAARLTSLAAATDFVFKKTIRDTLIQPTFVTNYPAYLVPLARRNDDNPDTIDMFQFVVNTWELVKAYSELVNPVTQRETFLAQAADKSGGDEEAMDTDEDFLLAMEHGFPPMSGLGLGLDRFISLLTDRPTLRDCVMFPTTK